MGKSCGGLSLCLAADARLRLFGHIRSYKIQIETFRFNANVVGGLRNRRQLHRGLRYGLDDFEDPNEAQSGGQDSMSMFLGRAKYPFCDASQSMSHEAIHQRTGWQFRILPGGP